MDNYVHREEMIFGDIDNEILLRKIFNEIDEDNNGTLDISEFRKFMPKVYKELGLNA